MRDTWGKRSASLERGSGWFCTAAFNDTTVEEAFGVDGIHEVALYVVGVGVPA